MQQLIESSENYYLTNQPIEYLCEVLEKLKVPQSRNPPHIMEPKVHCVVYNSPPPATNLGQINSFHALSSYFLTIIFNIKHLYLGLVSGLFLSGFPTKTLNTSLIFLHTSHMPHPYDSSLFYHKNKILFYLKSLATLSFLDLILSSAPHRRTVFLPQYDKISQT